VTDPAEHVIGPDSPSDSDAEGALTDAAPVTLLPQSSDRFTADTTRTVHEASKDEEVLSDTEKYNYLTTKGGGENT